MDFHLEYKVPALPEAIRHEEPILLMGSCFTENMAAKLKQVKFTTLENPHGILFNPVSIRMAIEDYVHAANYQSEQLFYFNESWHSWKHHSRFSAPEAAMAIQRINASVHEAAEFMKKAGWLMITLGSAFVYRLPGNANNAAVPPGGWVANCHKVPTNQFEKVLLSASEVMEELQQIIQLSRSVNPALKILFTISPVRHLRDGFVENNRSKAALIQAVHQICSSILQVYYFPAYELIIDDLRDYRFYAEDMVHPNYAATQYVWEKFSEACMSATTRKLNAELLQIASAFQHKPFNQNSVAHEQFLSQFYHKTQTLLQQNPFLALETELNYFGSKRTP